MFVYWVLGRFICEGMTEDDRRDLLNKAKKVVLSQRRDEDEVCVCATKVALSLSSVRRKDALPLQIVSTFHNEEFRILEESRLLSLSSALLNLPNQIAYILHDEEG